MKVGDRLWYVTDRISRKGEEVTVTKIGRRWAEISNGRRIDLKTWMADGRGYGSPGRCFASEADHEMETRRRALYFRFSQMVAYSPRDGVTCEDILEAARLLRLEPPEDADGR